jgi:hypothetical protein
MSCRIQTAPCGPATASYRVATGVDATLPKACPMGNVACQADGAPTQADPQSGTPRRFLAASAGGAALTDPGRDAPMPKVDFEFLKLK